ncbi:MAG: hypothetical protein KDD61_02960 [Bdellovibrionales bacterium]|nr:hypothetical protein [Bdellovibrionales bacterium]
MARPKKDLNFDKLNSYLQLKSSKRMCALLLEVSEDTIERRIKDEYGCTFSEYAEKMIAPVKLKLVQKAISKAMNGDNVLLIFCLKNLCGWSDKNEVVSVSEPSIKIDKHDEKL